MIELLIDWRINMITENLKRVWLTYVYGTRKLETE